LDRASEFATLLTHQGVERGLIGPREVPRLWERHLVNCALLGEAIEHGVEVCDLGSGAGLPGVVLGVSRPDLRVTLVEPLLRRTTFLHEVVEALRLDNVRVVRGRAEELHGVAEFDVVTSRAVAPLDRLARWSLPLVRLGGEMVAMKGENAPAEVASADKALRALGGEDVRIEQWGESLVERPTTVVRVRAGRPSHLSLTSSPKREESGTPRTRAKRRRRR
jgi:16S rRNA (guanine527-N7)-methyltransferase